ncbi:MAG: YIP1 family protein [Candidatus Bathyarchaeia archaeon]
MNSRESAKLSFKREIVGCLTSPQSTFKSILKKPSLVKGTAQILVIAIVAAWASFNYMSKLPLTFFTQQLEEFFPGEVIPVSSEQIRQASIIMSAVTALIGVFGTWFISSVLIHGFASVLRGKGSFKTMMTLVGYASTPLLIQQILRLAYSLLVGEEVLQLVGGLHISAYRLLNMIGNAAVDTFTIFRLWSIVLLIIAASENYKISTVRSVVAAALSFILIVFISAFFSLK